VARALAILQSELDLAMALAGVPTLDELRSQGRELVLRRG
jgi:isopentenyl diphosphate isomerase/L-lactate dehydrogenase-like FMN-dependent dehydrogenase